MPVTIATLGERALRRLGVAVVPVADRPALTATVSVATLAGRALQALGVTVTDAAGRSTTIVTVIDIAAKALQTLGVTVAAADRPVAAGGIPAATVAQDALVWLGVIAADETPSPADLAHALARVNAIHEELVAQAVASWTAAAIPLAVSEEYTLLTALHLAASFGKTADPAQVAAMEARIRKAALIMQAQTIAEQRVNAIHDGMVEAGIVYWTTAAIPQAVFDDYLALTAAQLAPLFGGQADPAAAARAEAHVRRVALLLQAQTRAEARVNAVHDGMVAQGFVPWAVTAIPQAVAGEYSALAAIRLAAVFEVKADPAEVPALEARVRQVALVLGAPALATEAVQSVHNDLSARGKIRWSVFDIPAAAEAAYLLLAAYRLAPAFGVQADPRDVQEATVALARIIALPTSGERIVVEYF